MKDRETFDEAFRRWAKRPAETTAAEAAAGLFEPRTRRGGRTLLSPAWATLASAALVIVTATAWMLRTTAPAPVTGSAASRLAAPSADSDVVVLWLDDQTPVEVFLTEASARGGK